MPLSEQEQRVLDEMERSLYHGDADFVASVGGRSGTAGYTALIGGILLAIVGVGVLVLGVVLHAWPVGVLGFLAMFAGVLIAFGRPGGARHGLGAPAKRRGTVMDRLAERWERRRQA